VQDTGFTRWLHADGGVLAFTNLEEAVEQVETLNRSYERQCAAARDVAHEYFDSDKVLSDLLRIVT